MKSLLRFADLKARGVANSWTQLSRLIQHYGFPRGRMLTSNVRAWDETDVDEWFRSRPVENKTPLKGDAKRRAMAAEARRKRDAGAP